MNAVDSRVWKQQQSNGNAGGVPGTCLLQDFSYQGNGIYQAAIRVSLSHSFFADEHDIHFPYVGAVEASVQMLELAVNSEFEAVTGVAGRLLQVDVIAVENGRFRRYSGLESLSIRLDTDQADCSGSRAWCEIYNAGEKIFSARLVYAVRDAGCNLSGPETAAEAYKSSATDYAPAVRRQLPENVLVDHYRKTGAGQYSWQVKVPSENSFLGKLDHGRLSIGDAIEMVEQALRAAIVIDERNRLQCGRHFSHPYCRRFVRIDKRADVDAMTALDCEVSILDESVDDIGYRGRAGFILSYAGKIVFEGEFDYIWTEAPLLKKQ